MTHKTTMKIGGVCLPQKQAKRPDFQGFLHSDPRRGPINIGVHRHHVFQTFNSSRKSRSA
jgi:hypothetical protein